MKFPVVVSYHTPAGSGNKSCGTVSGVNEILGWCKANGFAHSLFVKGNETMRGVYELIPLSMEEWEKHYLGKKPEIELANG